MVQANRLKYLKSIADELEAQATRVRDLIGDVHWLSDGHHKESVFLSVLRRHLPSGMIASRGFVIDSHDQSTCSSEQDILILDTCCEAPVLNQGNLLIAFPRQVVACISVKTRWLKKEVADSIHGLSSVRAVTKRDPRRNEIWYGAYFYAGFTGKTVNTSLIYDHIIDGVAAADGMGLIDIANPVCPDLFACSGLYACKFTLLEKGEGNKSIQYLSGFHCDGWATALFIGHLLDHAAIRRGETESQFLSSMDSIPSTPFEEARRTLSSAKSGGK
jgi:hypothetical protein